MPAVVRTVEEARERTRSRSATTWPGTGRTVPPPAGNTVRISVCRDCAHLVGVLAAALGAGREVVAHGRILNVIIGSSLGSQREPGRSAGRTRVGSDRMFLGQAFVCSDDGSVQQVHKDARRAKRPCDGAQVLAGVFEVKVLVELGFAPVGTPTSLFPVRGHEGTRPAQVQKQK